MMETDQLRGVIDYYRQRLINRKVLIARHPLDKCVNDNERALEHCHWMLGQMEGFIADNRLHKVNRWLGFIQGVLWKDQMFPLEELRQHNTKKN